MNEMTLSDAGRPDLADEPSRTGKVPPAVNPGRRRNMQANRRRDTGPEMALRRALHRAGHRYRCDLRIDLPDGRRVRPDIVFSRRRVAVFVDGCFWHCCPEHGRQPSINGSYWSPKLERNRQRDRQNTEALVQAGWRVVRVWEHQSVAECVVLVAAALGESDRLSHPGVREAT